MAHCLLGDGKERSSDDSQSQETCLLVLPNGTYAI